MRQNTFKKKLEAGQRGVIGWIATPNAMQAEAYASAGWDAVTIDMQHGGSDTNDLVGLMQAICLNDTMPMVRVPWNDPAYIMRALDIGAMGIICPMINTVAEAKAFVTAGRYPPLGARSNGPFRASTWAGGDYVQKADGEVQLFAMIETREALANLDEILKVPGLSGTYVGPSDLSLSFGKPATLDPSDPEVIAAIESIAKKTRAAGLIAGVHTDRPATAHKRYAQGYHYCTLLNDLRLLVTAAQQGVKDMRGEGGTVEQAKSY
jgi:4-hydroxy-2-oxoheptanedioate aldolase